MNTLLLQCKKLILGGKRIQQKKAPKQIVKNVSYPYQILMGEKIFARVKKVELSKTEKAAIQKRYEPLYKMLNLSIKNPCNIIYRESLYDNYRFYKYFLNNASADFFPRGMYRIAERILNPRWAAPFLEHKCNLDIIVPEQYLPTTILKITNGNILTKDNLPISKEEAERQLLSSPTFIAKIAFHAGGGGKSVYRVDPTTEEGKKAIATLLKKQHVIFQSVVKQSSFFAGFNETSVNTMRTLTLNLNGKVSVLSAFIRMGSKGSFVDNICSGGCCVGVKVNENGEINEWGLDFRIKKLYNAPSGLAFKGLAVPNFNIIKEQLIAIHQKIPAVRLIAWDIALDESNEMKVIEINLSSGGLEKHQAFNGPLFGDRTQEVIDFLQEQKQRTFPTIATFYA